MKREIFHKAVMNIFGGNKKYFESLKTNPERAKRAALICFIGKIDNNDSEIIRDYLSQLDFAGFVNWE